MKKLLYGLVVLGALFTTSCGSDDDKKLFGDASVTVEGKTTKMDNIGFAYQSSTLGGTRYTISRFSEDLKNTITVVFKSDKVGKFVIGSDNTVSFTVEGVVYTSVSGEIEVTTINEDTVKGTFKGKFNKSGDTSKTYDANGTFTAETPDVTDYFKI